jgi:hypothetical protein
MKKDRLISIKSSGRHVNRQMEDARKEVLRECETVKSTILLPASLHRKLKYKLLEVNISYAGWLREKVKEFVTGKEIICPNCTVLEKQIKTLEKQIKRIET